MQSPSETAKVEAVLLPPGKSPRRLLWKFVWSLAVLVILGYGGLGMWFVVNETRLIFHPSRQMSAAESTPDFRYERVELRTRDNLRLVGWEMRTPAGDSTGAWLLYLHGNAGNISGWTDRYGLFQRLRVNVFTADYRGYGESEGRPDEQGIYTDAEAMYDHLADALRVPAHRIIVYGHSLGGAVAIELASRREAGCLVVEGSFTSIVDRGQELYPYIPVTLLAQNRFTSIDKVGSLTLPKLFIHAVEDDVIPYAHGQELFSTAAPPKSFLAIHGGHSSAIFHNDTQFLNAMQTMLAGLQIVPFGKGGVRQGR